ncbi:MAG: sodium:dicarboxylate symporter [Leptospiraceae bacterium]|nr:MAG: sodium:dicarboxylate symporter [Leptospiraceae bacterium]
MKYTKMKDWIRKLYLPVGIPLGLIIGIFLGYYFPDFALSLKWLGIFFMKSLKMIIIPLVMLSIMNGIGRIGNLQKLGKKGLFTFIYYTITTAIAVIIGITFTLLLGFGDTKPPLKEQKPKEVQLQITDIFLNMIPSNIFESMANNEVLPVIVFSLLFGWAIALQGKRSEQVFRIFFILEEAIIKIVHLILWFAPIGILGLIASRIAEDGEQFIQELFLLQYYARNVIIGLMIHGLLVLPLIYFIIVRKNPFIYIKQLGIALGTAFSTASSSATLPVTMDCVENKAKIRSETAGFVLPLGATVNMDGTALYESVAAIFIAYVANIPLDFYSMILIFLTSTLAAIGAAGIPEAGLVTMTIVLKAVGLPLEGIALILSIDWFLDRCRTTINVLGDAIGAAIIDKIT